MANAEPDVVPRRHTVYPFISRNLLIAILNEFNEHPLPFLVVNSIDSPVNPIPEQPIIYSQTVTGPQKLIWDEHLSSAGLS